jgi:hypothetical protein
MKTHAINRERIVDILARIESCPREDAGKVLPLEGTDDWNKFAAFVNAIVDDAVALRWGTTVRPIVLEFALDMNARLDSKAVQYGGDTWLDGPITDVVGLSRRCAASANLLWSGAIKATPAPIPYTWGIELQKRAVDTANFAMMAHDRARKVP